MLLILNSDFQKFSLPNVTGNSREIFSFNIKLREKKSHTGQRKVTKYAFIYYQIVLS